MNKYRVEYTTKFKKSYKKLIVKQGRSQDDFKKVIDILANDIPLPEKYRNHLLEPRKSRSMGMPYKSRLVINL